MKKNSTFKIIISVGLTIIGLLIIQAPVSASIMVNSNVQSLNAIKKLNETSTKLAESFQRLSGGLKINDFSDDSAGLGVSDMLNPDVRSLITELRNVKEATSLIKTAEDAATEVANIIKRMRELAVQSASETLAHSEREYIQDEFDQLVDELADITTFDGGDEDDPDSVRTSSKKLKKQATIFNGVLEEIRNDLDDRGVEVEDLEDIASDVIKQIDKSSRDLAAAKLRVLRAAGDSVNNAKKIMNGAERNARNKKKTTSTPASR